jgi:hypothetical protein
MEPPVRYRKKLIEVALPLEAINKEAAREKYDGSLLISEDGNGTIWRVSYRR